MTKFNVNLFKRYLLLLIGLSIMTFGIAFSVRANLGTSPVSSVPYVISTFAPLTLGTATIAMHCVFILIQILVLRKNYNPIQLLQLPVAFFFGYLSDFSLWVIRDISPDTYLQQWICCAVGIFLVAVGVSFEVKANVVVLAGEGVVLAMCKAISGIKFGYMKVGFDVTLVGIACVLSIVFTGQVQGVREGTVAAALLVGLIAKRLGKLMSPVKTEDA